MRKEIKDVIEREVVTIEEFARESDISRETIHSAVKKGKMEAVKKGRDWLLDRQEIAKRKERKLRHERKRVEETV